METFQTGGEAQRPAVLMLHGADGLNRNTQYREGARAWRPPATRFISSIISTAPARERASFATLFQNFMPWMDTVQDALAFAANQPGADPHRIGIVGISLGAALGLAVASTDPRVKALGRLFRAAAAGRDRHYVQAAADLGAARLGRSHRARGECLCGRGAAAPAERAVRDQGLSRPGPRLPGRGRRAMPRRDPWPSSSGTSAAELPRRPLPNGGSRRLRLRKQHATI